MENRKLEFDAEIKKHPDLNAGFIEFPYDVRKEFGGKSRVKVKAYLNDHMYRGLLVKMGGDCHWLGITKEVRSAINKNFGDIIHVMIEEDKEERTVEIPGDLLDLLQTAPDTLEYFNSLSYTHKKEYVRWITGAKKEETRKNRLLKAVEMLKVKIKTPDQK
jgi:hypothetical protein